VSRSLDVRDNVKQRFSLLLNKQKQYVSACENARPKIPEVTDMKSMKDLIKSIEVSMASKDDRRNSQSRVLSKRSRRNVIGAANSLPHHDSYNPMVEPTLDRTAYGPQLNQDSCEEL
jgi:hypothetical protein